MQRQGIKCLQCEGLGGFGETWESEAAGGRSESLGGKQAAVEDGDHTLAPGLWGCLFGLCPEHPHHSSPRPGICSQSKLKLEAEDCFSDGLHCALSTGQC